MDITSAFIHVQQPPKSCPFSRVLGWDVVGSLATGESTIVPSAECASAPYQAAALCETHSISSLPF